VAGSFLGPEQEKNKRIPKLMEMRISFVFIIQV
jgi:hypothetical protein